MLRHSRIVPIARLHFGDMIRLNPHGREEHRMLFAAATADRPVAASMPMVITLTTPAAPRSHFVSRSRSFVVEMSVVSMSMK
jgi:hypothetical protein